MNKRCIVNVATGDFYCNMQSRLIISMNDAVDCVKIFDSDGGVLTRNLFEHEQRSGIDLIVWKDCLPIGSKPHSESPYGFKVHAIKAAYEMGYTSILWLDSPAYAVKEDITPIFEKIEKEGYYAMSHIDPLDNYVSDHVLSQFRMIDRSYLAGQNLPSGSCYGFDFNHPTGKTLFNRMYGCERNGHFAHHPPHRHDETILALLLIQGGKEIFLFDPLFQSDDERCVIKSGG